MTLIVRAGYQPGLETDRYAGEHARLHAELADLEATEERAVDDANAAGLNIAHRPEVLRRRARQAEDQQNDATRAARDTVRQAELEERHREAETFID